MTRYDRAECVEVLCLLAISMKYDCRQPMTFIILIKGLRVILVKLTTKALRILVGFLARLSLGHILELVLTGRVVGQDVRTTL